MRRVTFEWKEDHDYGDTGWIPKGFTGGANITSDFGLAHDCMEHFGRHDGTVQDELLAFGACWYVRGENSWWAQEGRWATGEEALGDDLGYMLRNIYYDDQRLETPKVWSRALRGRENSDYWLQAIADRALRTFRNEMKHSGADEEDWEAFARDPLLKRKIVHYLRMGYRRAAKRYRGVPGFRLLHTFNEIRRLTKGLHGEVLGELMHVRFDPAREEVRVDREYPADYY